MWEPKTLWTVKFAAIFSGGTDVQHADMARATAAAAKIAVILFFMIFPLLMK